MSYDNGYITTYHFGASDSLAGIDFGAGSDTVRVLTPPTDGPDSTTPGSGKRGRVVGVTIGNVTETFVGTTTGGRVLVGSSGDTDLYYATVAATLSGSAPAVAGSVFLPDDGSQIDIPAGETAFTVTLQACVGGSITGIADVTLEILWFGPNR